MKKTLFFILVGFFLFSACTENIATKEPGCPEYSLECELAKQYILIDPIEFDSTAKDAWGAQLDDGWYAINMDHPGVLLPVHTMSGSDLKGSSYDKIEGFVQNDIIVLDTLLSAEASGLQLENIQKMAIVYAGKNVFTFANSKILHGAEFTMIEY